MTADGGGQIPDVSEDGIVYSAQMIWLAATNDYTPNRIYRKTQNKSGQPGFLWHGSQSAVINNLWPALSDSHQIDKDKAADIRLILNRYLRESRNMVCERRGGSGYQSVWWISEHWSPLLVRTNGTFTEETEEEIVTEIISPKPVRAADPFDLSNPFVVPTPTQSADDLVPPEDRPYPCREESCDKRYAFARIRSRHEYHEHGLAVRPNGKIITFDPTTKPTDVEIDEAVLNVIVAAGIQIAHRPIWDRLREIAPRISKQEIGRSLDRLFAAGTIVEGDRTSNNSTFYELAGSQKTKPVLITDHWYRGIGTEDECVLKDCGKSYFDHKYRLDSPYDTEIDTSSCPPVEEDTTETAESRFSQHVSNLENLLTDIRSLSGAESDLTDLRATLERVTSERDDLQEELTSVTEQLKKVTEERNTAQKMLALLRRTLGAH